jgi:hypothetical protein
VARMKQTGGEPAATPPGNAVQGGGTGTAAAPRDLEELTLTGNMAAGGAAMPTLDPPNVQATVGATGVTAVTGTWLSDKRVAALWAISEVRNNWAYVAGIGWKKLYSASDSSSTAMAMLSSHARQTNCRFDYREEADGMIHEIYVW